MIIRPTIEPATAEFRIEESGLTFDDGRLGYAWFRLADLYGRSHYRAVAFKELTYLPIETRDDPDVLGKQWAALRGLYNADVDFLYTAVGVYQPQHLGVMQFYGAAAEAQSERAAADEARRRMAAVEATLANYPLSRLQAPDGHRVQMLVTRLERLPRVLAILGHPDPRQTKRGLGRDGSLGHEDDELASQQGELLLRGLAKLCEDFVFLVTAAHIGRPDLTEALIRMAQVASQYASRQRGAINLGFSIAIPLAAALGDSYAGQHGRSESEALSQSDAVSEGWGTGESRSWGHTVGQSESHGLAHTESYAETSAVSHTAGISHNIGTGHTDSQSDTTSGAQTLSQAHTDSTAFTQSQAHTDSVSHTTSQAHTDSGAHTDSYSQSVGTTDTDSWSTSESSGSSQSVTHSTANTTGTAQTEGTNWSEGQSQGASSSTAQSEGQSWAESQSQGIAQSVAETAGQSQGVTTSTGESTSVGLGWSEGAATTASQGESTTAGVSHSENTSGSASIGQSVGQSLSQAQSVQVGQSSNWSTGQSSADTVGTNIGLNAGVSGDVGIVVADIGVNAGVNAGMSASHTDGSSSSTGGGESVNVGNTVGATVSEGANTAVGASWGSSDSASVAQSVSSGVANTASSGSSGSVGASQSSGVAESQGTAQSTTTGHSTSSGMTSSTGGSSTTTNSTGEFASTSSSVGGSSATTTSQSTTTGVAESSGTFQSTSSSVGGSHSTSQSESWGSADTQGWADTVGTADTVGSADTTGTAQTTGSADTRGVANTQGWASTFGVADSKTQGQGWFESTSTSHATTHGTADTESWTQSVMESWSEGRAVSRSHEVGRSHGQGVATAQALAMSGGHAFSGGFSAGMVPGISIGRSWQTEDDLAIRLTELTRGLESLLNQASMEGGFMTTALLFVGEQGERAAAALAPQAFHGPNVPTPVLTVPGDDRLRLHALAFRPSLEPFNDPFGVDLLWTRWGTLLTPGMLAAYTAPNLFEEGTVVTIQEKLPPLAFYPELEGDVVLGHLVSPETGDLTKVPLKLARQRHFHTAFVGDTGYGKSVAAERLVYETTVRWHLRTIVLDFGAGWRKLLNAPGLEGHVEIRQLSPGGVRPLRWNPLQIGRHILPEVQWRAFCDIFGAIAKLGVRRQVAELREALRRIYLRAGVLVDDPECRNDATWGRVKAEETNIAHASPGTPLAQLAPENRQRLAVERSKAVGLIHLYREVEEKLRTVPPRDSMLRGVLEGILFRLHPLVQGAAAAQYAPGTDTVDINAVVSGEWGVAVLEGGAFLDDFSKAVLLGWAAWQLYTDAVVQRIRRGVTEEARIQIVFEEANKILAGLDNAGSDDESGGTSTAEQFANMWRDSRKYGIWLHLITQSPSLIPPGILSSCNNLLVSQVKNPKDRDLIVAAFHRSEKGFVDEGWRRFLASLPIARAVAKLGYSFERAELEPCYLQPLQVMAPEPSDEEIEQRLGKFT